MVPVRDRSKDGPVVPEFKVKNSSNVVDSFVELAKLMLMTDGFEKLNNKGVTLAVKSMEITIASEREATPELDLQRMLLSESHNEN